LLRGIISYEKSYSQSSRRCSNSSLTTRVFHVIWAFARWSFAAYLTRGRSEKLAELFTRYSLAVSRAEGTGPAETSLTGNYSEGRLSSLLLKVAQSVSSASTNWARGRWHWGRPGDRRRPDPVEPLPHCHTDWHGFLAILQCRKRRPDRKAPWPKTTFKEWRHGRDKARHSLVPSLRPISSGAFGPKPRRFYRERDSGEVPGVA
jgi:hypothetical protein